MTLKRKAIVLLTVVLCLYGHALSQNLTVREIMAEPSIAGMRVEGEKLSPDGSKVVFLWNADGKMPRDLYMASTDGRSTPQVILRVSDLPKPSASPTPENKLDYGLVVKDDFVKARENQLGGFEWSPDSKKLVFSQGGDLFVLNIYGNPETEQMRRKLRYLTLAINRLADLIPEIVIDLKTAAVQEPDLFSRAVKARKDWSALTTKGSELTEKEMLDSLDQMKTAVSELLSLETRYRQLRQSQPFLELKDQNTGIENRINVAKLDLADTRSMVSSRVKRYTKTQAPEVGARFLDNDRILYQQNGNLFVLNTADATTVQLTKEADLAKFISVGQAVADKSGKMIAYVVSDNSKQKALIVPNYLDEFVQAGTVRKGWSDQKLYVTPADGSRDTPFEIKLPKQEGVGNYRNIKWAADGRSLIVDRGDKDTKRRQLFYIHNAGSKDEQIILVTEETDDKWLAPLSAIVEPNPKDTSQLIFCSERDGYNHIYLATLEKRKAEPNPTGEIRQENPSDAGYSSNVAIKQLTKGNWQVEWAKWVAHGEQVIFSSTEENPAERRFYAIRPENGDKAELLAFDKGMRTGPQMDDQNDLPTLLFSFSQWNRPDDLYAQKVCPRCRGLNLPEPITKTTPETFGKMVWNSPTFIDIPSRDGKQIKSKVYLPAGHDAKKKYPMAIFVHGAGYLQNTINGWNNYYREFMFNQILTQKGYVVLDIDYRGSAGYGRDWRTDVYDFLGGKDMDDHVDAIDYVVRNYGVDQKHIGVYGGSYGGFMAGMLAMRAPERIAAAAALRPVLDWKNYYASSPGYTAQRLGFPDKNPEAYKRSSPISYADKLERPLLILHGMADDNVPVQDSVQLMEKLIRLGKTRYFEAMLYPSENHGFVRSTSWTDEYERILAFFEKNLK